MIGAHSYCRNGVIDMDGRVYLVRVPHDAELDATPHLAGLIEAGCVVELAAVTGLPATPRPMPVEMNGAAAEPDADEQSDEGPDPDGASEPEATDDDRPRVVNEPERPARPPSKAPVYEPRADGLYKCPDCGRTFSKPQGLGRHRRTAHNVRGKRSPGGRRFSDDDPLFDPRKSSYDCPYCNKTFGTAQGLKIHLGQEHSKEAQARAKRAADARKTDESDATDEGEDDPEPDVERLSVGGGGR